MRLSPIDLAFALAILALLVVAFVHFDRGRARGLPGLPANPTLTPGSLNLDVTQATIGTTICVHGWTKTVRPPASYTSSLKIEQMRAYGEAGSPREYQEDHLISLELGGNATDPRNLWPEPYPRASAVDRVENQLNARVCSGTMTLEAAQRAESALKHEYG